MSLKAKTVIIGKSAAIHSVLNFISKAADSSLPVLIEGESGTGKELVASSIHEQSKRFEKPFIEVNCGALPKDLLENELFGHEAGAFTGANAAKRGLFEIADGGTLFIDEIGELDIGSQVKLLHVIESNKFRRLGSTKELTVDVRIISATNKILETEIASGDFRPDLYYRLSSLRSFVPALRDRKEDIKHIADNYIENKINTLLTKDLRKSLDKGTVETLEKYNWPGNIRELQNVLNRSALMCKGNKICVSDLPEQVRNYKVKKNTEIANQCFEEDSLDYYMDAREREYILHLMLKYDNNKNIVMKILGISRAQFYRKFRKIHAFLRTEKSHL